MNGFANSAACLHTLAQVPPDMIRGDSRAQALRRSCFAKPGAQIPKEPGSGPFLQTAVFISFFGFCSRFNHLGIFVVLGGVVFVLSVMHTSLCFKES